MRAALLLALVGACSIPDVDLTGKSCPCLPDYVCIPSTNRCEKPSTIDAPIDAFEFLDAPRDAPGTLASCLGIPNTAVAAFFDDFSSLGAWNTTGAWSALGGEAVQTDKSIPHAYAQPSSSIGGVGNDYRATVRARRVNGTGAFALSMRMQGADEMSYCRYLPDTRVLELGHIDSDFNTSTLASQTVTLPAGLDPDGPFTIEVSALGATAKCCLREVPGSSILTTLLPVQGGRPGMRTDTVSAAFDEFRVYVPEGG